LTRWQKFTTYFKALSFLSLTLLRWAFCGWKADYAFPFSAISSLIFSCINGELPKKINSLQRRLRNKEVILTNPSLERIQKLYRLENQGLVYKEVIDILGLNGEKLEKIASVLQELDNKTREIQQELEPHEPQRYKDFSKLQDRSWSSNKNQNDYVELQKLTKRLSNQMKASKNPAQILKDERNTFLEDIRSKKIILSASGLNLAYQFFNLIASTIPEIRFDGKYLGNLKTAKKYHFHPQCSDWQSLVYRVLYCDDKEIIVSNTSQDFNGKLGSCNSCEEWKKKH
jgi:hypothetical protein